MSVAFPFNSSSTSIDLGRRLRWSSNRHFRAPRRCSTCRLSLPRSSINSSSNNAWMRDRLPKSSLKCNIFFIPAQVLKRGRNYNENSSVNWQIFSKQLVEFASSSFYVSDAHGFATPPPSVLPRSADGSTHNNSGIPPSFFTPPSHHDQRHNAAPHGISNAASFASLFGCQPVPQVDAQRLHSPALTPPESAADHAVRQNPLEAQLEAPKLQQASGHDAESNAQAAATTAVVQQVA